MLCNTYYRSSGSSGSNEECSHTDTAPPKQRGQSPNPGRFVTPITDLQVPAVLTKMQPH
ncbi:MAG UNVERIFIED_CONTAM: hypothetical protein LVR18_45100 [Planctomycetaceae bacterium]